MGHSFSLSLLFACLFVCFLACLLAREVLWLEKRNNQLRKNADSSI